MTTSRKPRGDSATERKRSRRHRREYRHHKQNPCPHGPATPSGLAGEFKRHPGRRRHNRWHAEIRWKDVRLDDEGLPILVKDYRVEVYYSASEGTFDAVSKDDGSWFLHDRYKVRDKESTDDPLKFHKRVNGIHGRLWYGFRVQAQSQSGCDSDWGYYSLDRPNDGPPAPQNVQILRASHAIRLRWESPPLPTDDELLDENVTHYIAQLWTNADFGPSLDFTANAGTDVFTASGHGFDNGDHVMLSQTPGSPSLPGGTHPWRPYLITNKTTDTFKLARLEDSAAIGLSTDGDGVVHWGLVRASRHVHRTHHLFRIDVQDFDEDELFYGRVESVSGDHTKSAWIPATAPVGNDDPDATPTAKRPLWHRHGGLTFTIPGRVQQKVYHVPHRMDDDYVIRRVTAACDRSGSGGSTHFDIKINGGPYVFDLSGPDQVHLGAGDHDGSSKDITNGLLSRGDHIRVRCTQVASTPPRDVTVSVVADRYRALTTADEEADIVDSGGGGGSTSVLLAAKGRSSTTSDLYSVDPTTGNVTSIGATGFALTSITQDPTTGIIYASTSNNSTAHPHSLVTLDPVTGAGTFVAAFSGGKPMPGLAFDATGTLLGRTSDFVANTDFVSIDLATAVETVLGSSGSTAGASNMAFDDAGTLWAAVGADVGTIDPVTGAFTAVYSSAVPDGTYAATFDSGLLWVIYFTGSNLWTVDLATGDTVDIGALGTSNLDALGWVEL